MININKLLVKTTYPARRSDTPLVSVSKRLLLNKSFIDTYLKNWKEGYVNLVSHKNKYCLVVSKKKLPNFYLLAITFRENKATAAFSAAKGFVNILGDKVNPALTVRYTVTKEPTNNPSVVAFILEEASKDIFTSTNDKL
jgi:hypothetical protein